MGTGVDRFLWSVLLLLPAIGLNVALPGSWLPGEYANTTADALRFLDDYNTTAEEVLFLSVTANWNYNTDITDQKLPASGRTSPGVLKLEGDALAEPSSHADNNWAHLDQFLAALAPRHHKCMRGRGSLWSLALPDLEITPIHVSPDLHAQLPPNAANSACVSQKTENWFERLLRERLQALKTFPWGGLCAIMFV